MDIVIKTTPEQYKAMEYVAVDPAEWLQNAWDNRARQAMDEIILEHTDKRIEKLSQEEKIKLIAELPIKTAKERHEKMLREIASGT